MEQHNKVEINTLFSFSTKSNKMDMNMMNIEIDKPENGKGSDEWSLLASET